MAQAPTSKKVANSLVAVGAAAVMAVYAAGYSKTRSAADRFDAQSAGRGPLPLRTPHLLLSGPRGRNHSRPRCTAGASRYDASAESCQRLKSRNRPSSPP